MDHRAADCVYPPIVAVTFVVMIVQVVQNLIVMEIMIYALTLMILLTPVLHVLFPIQIVLVLLFAKMACITKMGHQLFQPKLASQARWCAFNFSSNSIHQVQQALHSKKMYASFNAATKTVANEQARQMTSLLLIKANRYDPIHHIAKKESIRRTKSIYLNKHSRPRPTLSWLV